MNEQTHQAALRVIGLEWWVRISLVAVVALGASVAAGFRVNMSRSLPLGLYRVVRDRSTVERGSMVIVCLPQEWVRFALRREILGPGHCEGGSYGLGKMVFAVEGDVVELRRNALTINGTAIPNSRTLEQDSRGRPLPHYPWGTYILQTGSVWLFSPFHRAAFDSRYFGPVSTSSIRSAIRPVWTGWRRTRRAGSQRQLHPMPLWSGTISTRRSRSR